MYGDVGLRFVFSELKQWGLAKVLGSRRKGGYVHSHVEEHAVCFAVAEALALGVGFAEGAAGIEGILCAA